MHLSPVFLYDIPPAIEPLLLVLFLAAATKSRVLLALAVCIAIYRAQGDTTTAFEWAVFSILLLTFEAFLGRLVAAHPKETE